MNIQRKTKGFTIIEVVLVLAIAGLIFLMVFTALPALQKSQRDTARKQDISVVSTAVTNYLNNNRGTFPPDSATLTSYASNISSNTTTITVAPSGTTSAKPADGEIIVTQATTCDTSSSSGESLKAATSRHFTAVVLLEAAQDAYYCQDN